VVYGDSREQGIVRGSEFLHPDLRFAVTFPRGWEIANSAQQVTASAGENANAALVLQVAEGNGAVEQVARSEMTSAGFRELQGQRTDVNGLSAYVGVYDGVMNNTPVRLRAAHIRSNQQTYLLAGLAATSTFSRADEEFQATIRSFREMSAQEASRIQPSRVEFYTVRSGDTWESLARRASLANVKASTLAIMNGANVTGTPRVGDRIRIVVVPS
jgi:predicted Zn-dependent protease